MDWCTCGHPQSEHYDWDGDSNADGKCLAMIGTRKQRRCPCKSFKLAEGPPKERMSADHILGLLRERHAQDVFVPECKNGPTHQPVDQLLKFDAWAMPKSWAHWCTIGYEIKVSRSDFEQDQKWIKYLPYCHQFYFVCPGGLIRSVDIPDGVGLLWVSQNGTRLHRKVPAKPHDPDPRKLLDLMSYVLMARSVVVANMHEANGCEPPEMMTPERRREELREWTNHAAEREELASFIRGHVAKMCAQALKRVNDAQGLENHVEEFTCRLAKLGITWDHKANDWTHNLQVDREIDALVGALDWHTLNSVEDGAKSMLQAVAQIRKLRKDAEQPVAVEEERP